MDIKGMKTRRKIRPNGKILLLSAQLILLAAAVLFWLCNRGNALQKTFTPDEYIVTESTVITEDVTVDDTMSQAGIFMETPALSLEKGLYQIEIGYNANHTGSSVTASSATLDETQLHCAVGRLNPNLHHITLMLELTRDADDVVISCNFSGEGYLSITSMGIFETSAIYKRTMFYAFLLCLLLTLIYLFIRGGKAEKGVLLALTGIFVISSYFLFSDHLLYGDDLFYHLLRIEGIQKGMSYGSFPVKIHPVWAYDYGYAVGVFYGDLALYFPAMLRLLGFSVQTAYKFLVGAINLGTIVAFYFSFRHMFHSRQLGILGCILGSLNFYRLVDVYKRAAIGECLGILFFPLVLLSFYLIFMETDEKNWKKHAILTALSLSGLVQSHILSCEITAVIILFCCLVLVRKVFRKYIFRTLVLAAFLSVILNTGFLVPLLDFYNAEILIGSPEWEGCTTGSLQSSGLDPLQIFTQISKNADPKLRLSGIFPSPAYGIGLTFGIGILLFILLLVLRVKKCRSDKNFYPALLCFCMGCILLFMSSNRFPWDALSSISPLAERLCYSIEFPWRLLAPAATLLSFSICYVISAFYKHWNKAAALATAAVLAVLLLLNAVWFICDRAQNSPLRYIYATEDLDTMLLSTNDYLPTVTDPDEIYEGWFSLINITSFDDYTKRGTEIRCHVTAGAEGGYIDFPLNYYRYYQCTDDTGRTLPVSSGQNGMLRVTLPADYDGNIHVVFKEPLHWRMAECISLAACLGILFAALPHRRKNHMGSGHMA